MVFYYYIPLASELNLEKYQTLLIYLFIFTYLFQMFNAKSHLKLYSLASEKEI